MPLQARLTLLLASALITGGCGKPLGIVRTATDGAEALTTKAEDTVKAVHGKIDAFGHTLKAKVKDLGEDLTTWKDEDAGAITPAAVVHVDQGTTIH